MKKLRKLWLPLLAVVALAGWLLLQGVVVGSGDYGASAAQRAEMGVVTPPPPVATYAEPVVQAATGEAQVGLDDKPGEEQGEALHLVFPKPEMPGILNGEAIQESLSLLRKNGSDLLKPMASRHRVMAATPAVAGRISQWAQANGYTAREPQLVLGHGGVPRFAVEVVRQSVPQPEVILSEGREVLEGAGNIPGAWYQTWEGEIVR